MDFGQYNALTVPVHSSHIARAQGAAPNFVLYPSPKFTLPQRHYGGLCVPGGLRSWNVEEQCQDVAVIQLV